MRVQLVRKGYSFSKNLTHLNVEKGDAETATTRAANTRRGRILSPLDARLEHLTANYSSRGQSLICIETTTPRVVKKRQCWHVTETIGFRSQMQSNSRA
jgi:hypothetical protein